MIGLFLNVYFPDLKLQKNPKKTKSGGIRRNGAATQSAVQKCAGGADAPGDDVFGVDVELCLVGFTIGCSMCKFCTGLEYACPFMPLP